MTGEVPAAITPTVAAQLLERHGLAPRKAAGQNFVVDPNTVDRIVTAAAIDPGATVLEIGPGLGSLTLALARVARRVVAIEVDAGLAGVVARLVAPLGNVEVVHADALRVDLGEVLGEPARLVANLPYNVATPLLFTVLESGFVDDAWVMVQREVGQRWAARVGEPLYAGVSVKLALVADVRVAMTIPRVVFLPVPNVDSVMVHVARRADAPALARWKAVAAVVDAGFAQRRKTLRNTMRAAYGPAGEEALAAAGIDPSARAETLAPAAFAALADHLPAGPGGTPLG